MFPYSNKKGMYMSIYASNPYLHKSHEELRWEDYKQGCKGGLFSAAHASPIGSRPNAAFSSPNVLPSMFPPMVSTTGVDFNAFPRQTIPSSNGFDQRNAPFTGFVIPSSTTASSTTVPPINASVQRPHETATVFPPAPGCTACGETSSSSTSGHFTFNGATTPPSAATTPNGWFFPTAGFGPMMFGITLAVLGTTPALKVPLCSQFISNDQEYSLYYDGGFNMYYTPNRVHRCK